MASTKLIVFFVAFMVLVVNFSDRKYVYFVEGRPQVNVVKHDDVNFEKSEKVDPEDFSVMDYDTMKRIVEERRSALEPKAIEDVPPPTQVIPDDNGDAPQPPTISERRQISNDTLNDNGNEAKEWKYFDLKRNDKLS